MKAAEYLEEIRHRISPERLAIIENLIEQTRITRSRPKPMPVPSADKGYGRYASPVLYGTPAMVRIDSETAKEVLHRCRMFPRQKPIDQKKLQHFIDLIKTGEWMPEKRAPIMISRAGVILNGRHRLNAIAQSGGAATVPVLDELHIIVELNK